MPLLRKYGQALTTMSRSLRNARSASRSEASTVAVAKRAPAACLSCARAASASVTSWPCSDSMPAMMTPIWPAPSTAMRFWMVMSRSPDGSGRQSTSLSSRSSLHVTLALTDGSPTRAPICVRSAGIWPKSMRNERRLPETSARRWSALEFPRQNHGGGRPPDALHLGDPVDHRVEVARRLALDLDREIEMAAQRVALHDFRPLLQRRDHAALLPDLQLDQDEGGDRRDRAARLAEDRGVAGDHPVAFEPGEAALHRRPRDAERLGDVRQRQPRILGENTDEFAVLRGV